jgi:hypothetical protein
VGDSTIMSNYGQWPVLNGLSSCLLQARHVLWAKLRLGKVDARLSRDLERETMSNLSLRSHKPLPRLPPAVFGSCFFACRLDMPDCDCMLRTVGAAGESGEGVRGG